MFTEGVHENVTMKVYDKNQVEGKDIYLVSINGLMFTVLATDVPEEEWLKMKDMNIMFNQ